MEEPASTSRPPTLVNVLKDGQDPFVTQVSTLILYIFKVANFVLTSYHNANLDPIKGQVSWH